MPACATDDSRLSEQLLELARRDRGCPFEVPRPVGGGACLADNGLIQPRGNVIHRLNQSIEGQLHPDRDKDQRTLPRYLGPRGEARCSHCVRCKSAIHKANRPLSESLSELATLSIQMA